jgi:hypothetical protein
MNIICRAFINISIDKNLIAVTTNLQCDRTRDPCNSGKVTLVTASTFALCLTTYPGKIDARECLLTISDS